MFIMSLKYKMKLHLCLLFVYYGQQYVRRKSYNRFKKNSKINITQTSLYDQILEKSYLG